MTKIYKTKTYRVTYTDSNGADHFSGAYILSQAWLMRKVQNGTAILELKR